MIRYWPLKYSFKSNSRVIVFHNPDFWLVKNTVVLMYSHFMLLSQYLKPTLWTSIYARQARSNFCWLEVCGKYFIYVGRPCQSLTPPEVSLQYKYSWLREATIQGKLESYRFGWRSKSDKEAKRSLKIFEMPGLYQNMILVAAVSLAVPAVVRSSPVVGSEPIRCAPCTQEKLNSCPAIPADCNQVLREPGCGCCMACALEKGASCGVHTAHCAEGLHCTPRPGEARPLHALTRGQGVCTGEQGKLMFHIPSSWIYDLRRNTGSLTNLKFLFRWSSGSPWPRFPAVSAGAQPSLWATRHSWGPGVYHGQSQRHSEHTDTAGEENITPTRWRDANKVISPSFHKRVHWELREHWELV